MGQQNISRFDVAMDNATRVSKIQGGSQLSQRTLLERLVIRLARKEPR